VPVSRKLSGLEWKLNHREGKEIREKKGRDRKAMGLGWGNAKIAGRY